MNGLHLVSPRQETTRTEIKSVRHLGGRTYEVTAERTETRVGELSLEVHHHDEVPRLMVQMAYQEGRRLPTGGRLNLDVSPKGGTYLLREVRYRDERVSVVVRCGAPSPVPSRSVLISAFEAREAAIEGRDDVIDAFSTTWLRLPPRQAVRWREAVSQALLADWSSIISKHAAEDSVLSLLKAETRRAHVQLQPVWMRKTGGHRVHLLDKPVAGGLKLADLITDHRLPEDTLLSRIADNPGIEAVLRSLQPAEQRVAAMWALHPDLSWAQAAELAGAEDPTAMGKRICRKVKRLGGQYTARALARAEVTR